MSGPGDSLFLAVPFAVDAQGVFRDITQVPNGLGCACYCADCGTAVVAKNDPDNKRVPHFAHKSRVECWNTLEAAFWGMACQILTEPGALLAVPAAGQMTQYLPDLRELAAPSEIEVWKRREWVLPEVTVRLQDGQVRAKRLRDAKPGQADIAFRGLYVCFIFRRRQVADLKLPDGLKNPVLAIDLSAYAKIWIETCGEREQEVRSAMASTDMLRRWLAGDITGRIWLNDPHVLAAVAKLRAEASAGASARAQAWRAIEAEQRRRQEAEAARAAAMQRAKEESDAKLAAELQRRKEERDRMAAQQQEEEPASSYSPGYYSKRSWQHGEKLPKEQVRKLYRTLYGKEMPD